MKSLNLGLTTFGVGVVIVLAAACGGVAPVPLQAGASQAPISATSERASSPAEPTPTPAAPLTQPPDAPAPTAPTSTGGGTSTTANGCLVTAAEAGQILGVSGITATNPYEGMSYCSYIDSTGEPFAVSDFGPDGRGTFGLMKTASDAQDVDGLGDDAIFVPSSATLAMLKGNALYTVVAGVGSDPEAQRFAWARQFAEIALGRMP